MPALFIGCGDDESGSGGGAQPTPTATPVGRPRERRALDFDFSFAEVDQLEIHVLRSPSHRSPVLEHDDASRARHRQLNPTLVDVPDDHLTHYIEDVDLPSDALQLVQVKGRHVPTGAEALVSMHVHRPIAISQAAGRQMAALGIAPNRWAQASAVGGAADTVIDVDTYQTPTQTAVALVFHNHELTNLNADQGTCIINLIETLPCASSGCTPFIATLAEMVGAQWPATTAGGWATLTQILDTDGAPIFDSDGDPVYQYVPSDAITQTACSVAAEIKKLIFDDPTYEGNNYHPTEGTTVSDGSDGSSSAGVGGGAATTTFNVTGAHPAGTTAHGVKFETIGVTDQGNRTVQVEFRNAYIRYLSTFVQFANESGDLPVQNPTSLDTSRAKFLSYISANYTLLGIPLIGDDIPLSSVQFDVPSDASIAKVYFGSLGLGGQAFCPEATGGSDLTLVFAIGLPAFFLLIGALCDAALQSTIAKYIVTTDGIQLVTDLDTQAQEQSGSDSQNGIFGTESSSKASAALASLGSALLSGLMAGGAAVFKQIAEGIAEDATESEAFTAAGPIGMVFKVIAIGSNLAAIAESVGESLASPAIFINTICLTQTTTVTIDHDPDDFQFPATARNYEIILTYDGSSVIRKATGTISPGRTDPIVESFDNVPSGGTVTVDVYLTTDDNCIVGRSTDADGNVGPFGPVAGNQASIELTIKELLVPLTADTEYNHVLKLEYQNGEHVWVQTDAPTATLGDLCAGQDNALCDLNEITIGQRTGMAGYSFQAGGQNIALCDGGTASILQVIQNIFLGQNAQSGFKQLSCGFTQPVGIVYERLGPPDGTGMNFFLEPSTDSFLVKSVVADTSTPFDVSTAQAWGQFSEPLDSVALVPTGYLVGVNRMNHKMEILELPPAAVDSNQAPQSVAFAVQKMGLGTRPGLLGSPVALAVFGTTILILEDGNRRIQAVDVSGNPVLQFQGQTMSLIDLSAVESDPSSVVYLDIGVEGLGYMYVLSYTNGGLSADDYRLDIWDPDGNHLLRKTGVAAARMAVDTFRNVYTLNYETIVGAPRVEPSLSQWEPSTPAGCPTPTS